MGGWGLESDLHVGFMREDTGGDDSGGETGKKQKEKGLCNKLQVVELSGWKPDCPGEGSG